MARTARNGKLDTRSARARLTIRREPYWVVISTGCALGYRKIAAERGTWIARFRDDAGKQNYRALGAADDAQDADVSGVVLDYATAQAKARDWFALAARGETAERGEDVAAPVKKGPYTVHDALTDYIAAYTRKGGKALDRTQWAADALIFPTIGSIVLSKLSKRRIETWLDELAKAPPRLRTKTGEAQKFRKLDESADGLRRRKSTANRVLTILKAALNHAHQEGKVSSDDAWRRVKAFREVDAARVRYLNDDEARRVVNAADPAFRPLVQAALLTGCRYGELTALAVSDYNADAGTIHIRQSKSGKPRHVVLTDEGRGFFDGLTAGKTGAATIFTKASEDLARIARLTGMDYGALSGLTVADFTKDGGESMSVSREAAKAIGKLAYDRDAEEPLIPTPHFVQWGQSHQQRPFETACTKAKIGDLTFHELRHTYASRLVMAGAPLAVVAAQLGHSDTRMVEKHYGHLAPSYVADTVRSTFGHMGIAEPSTVTPMTRRAVS